MKSLAALVSGAVFVAAIALAAEPNGETEVDFIRPFPIVAVPVDASDAHKAAAKAVADAIGPGIFSELKTNPVCCVWLEINGWMPNPGEPGYVIINQAGGSIISASNEEQLRAAVERFKASIRKNGDQVEVPAGLLTSYKP